MDRVTRERIVREHMESENRHEFDVTMATFEHPRYEIVPTGEVYDGADEVHKVSVANALLRDPPPRAPTARPGDPSLDEAPSSKGRADRVSALPERAEREHRQQEPPHGDVNHGEVGRHDPGRCEPDRVPERRTGDELPPRPGQAQEGQQPAPEEQHQDVREDQRRGVRAHGDLIRDTHSGCSPARTCVMNFVWRSAGSAKYDTTTVASFRSVVCTAGRR